MKVTTNWDLGVLRFVFRVLVQRLQRHRDLMVWNRDFPRPRACAHVPDRIWRRRSALLSLRSGWVEEHLS